MPFEITVGAGRARAFSGSLYAVSGVGFVLGPNDELRLKIGRGNAPLLDMVSTTPTANGSTLTVTGRGAAGPPAVPATYQVSLLEADTLAIGQGCFDVEVLQVDNTVSPVANRSADSGVLHILGEMTGSTGD
jgi:hypothetical protein